MSKPLPEVQHPVILTGTAGADLMLVTQAVVTAHPQFALNPWDLEVEALGGDDGIVRDRTGAYGGSGLRYRDTSIDGGPGSTS
jgi:hypothetical protein